jgi:RNA polymerase sigma-70 factor (ECF subfamily)
MELQLRLSPPVLGPAAPTPVRWDSPAGVDIDEPLLIAQARKDREAFGILYRRHYGVVAGYIYRRTGDRHLTEDLVADVFVAALRYLPKYRVRGVPLRGWLYRIACNMVNRWVRRQRKQIAKSLDDLEAKRPDERTGQDSEHARLAMLSLAPKFQAVLSLHYLEGLSVEEVAATIGCRVGTVKSRLSRGRDAIRKKLEHSR